jgi:hypothetical protein
VLTLVVFSSDWADPSPIPSLPNDGPPPTNLPNGDLSVTGKSPNVNEGQVSIANVNACGEQPRDVNNVAPFLKRVSRNEEARGKTVGYEVY